MRILGFAALAVLFLSSPALAQSCDEGFVFDPDQGTCVADPGAGGGGNGTGGSDDGTTPRLIRFLTPDDGDSFTAGTTVAPTGRSSLSFAQDLPLDLTIMLDVSRSMLAPVDSQGTRLYQVAAQAATNLIDILPSGSEFTLVTFGDRVEVLTTKFDPNGGFGNPSFRPLPFIRDHITNLIPNGTETRLRDAMTATRQTFDQFAAINQYLLDDYDREILLLSDGLPTPSSQIPTSFDLFSFAAYGDITTVGLPGIPQQGLNILQTIADPLRTGQGQFFDYANDPQGLIDDFANGSTVLSGLERIEITDPDGNTYNVASDALGQFTLDGYVMKEGDNIFTATAIFADQTTESATLRLVGTASTGDPVAPIPLPAPAWLLVAAIAVLVRQSRG